MSSQEHGQSEDAPIGGAVYRHSAREGLWRVETAGSKWVKFRSTTLVGRGDWYLTFKERREDWPNGWERERERIGRAGR